jgi:hypothetical protein
LKARYQPFSVARNRGVSLAVHQSNVASIRQQLGARGKTEVTGTTSK